MTKQEIENMIGKDISFEVFMRVYNDHYSPKWKWRREKIEQIKCHVAWASCMMVAEGHATPEWGREQIERVTEDVAWAIDRMVSDGYATPGWRETLVEKLNEFRWRGE